ncbi:MAG: O-antigen ligase family protein [Clostridiaceae bacterium]|nr:O-antigen ligase family protein [Clostridiaceae bacterium]
MKAFCGKLERFFLFFLFVNPFLDIFGGIYTKMSETYALPGVSPSLLARMLVLLVMAFYLLAKRDWKAVLTVLPVGIVFVVSFLLEVQDFYAVDLSSDVQYIIRFGFNLAALLCYTRVFKDSGISKSELLTLFDRCFRFSAAMLSLAVVLPYLFGVGYYTYGDRFGFRGCRGFFYSGNDITAVLMLLLPLSIASFYRVVNLRGGVWRWLCYVLPPAFTVAALLLIGTKTAFLGLGFILVVMLGWALWRAIVKKERNPVLRFLCILVGVFLTLLVLKLFAPTDVATTIIQSIEHPAVVAPSAGVLNSILSGRQYKLANAFRMWKESLPLSALFGVGRGTQEKVIEMDILEVFFYYGVLGFIAMLWLYFREGVRLVGNVFRRFDVQGLALLAGVGLCTGYLLIAGHVLFSVTSGFWYALLLAYAALYYRKEEII